MLPLFLAIGVVTGLCAFSIYAIRYRKDFIGHWNGHRIQVTYKYLSLDVHVDEQPVLINAKYSTPSFNHTFDEKNHTVTLPKYTKSSDKATLVLSMDNDTVQLIQTPQNVFGNTLPSQIPKTLPRHRLIEGTPQLKSAQNLYNSIKAEIADDTEITELLDTLMEELVNHVRIAQRIQSSESDYQALGSNQDKMAQAKKQNEERIELLLTSLQDIHLTILQRSVINRDHLQSDLRIILARLQTQIEMDRQRT